MMCEDVRDELGNKKSIMGIFSGDVLVSEFPAQFRIAFYIEYVPPKEIREQGIDFTLTIANENVAAGKIIVPAQHSDVVSVVIPQGLARFSEPGNIILKVGPEGDALEILNKKVRLTPQAN